MSEEDFPCYLDFFNDPMKVVLSQRGEVGYQLNSRTGRFEFYGWVGKYLNTGGGVNVDIITRDEFIWQVEWARSRLSGDGPQFAIYETAKAINDLVVEEKRGYTDEENALLTSLFRQTYAMWAAEWGAEGDPPDVAPPEVTDTMKRGK